MNLDEIRLAARERPFKPFGLKLKSGIVFHIDLLEKLAVGKSFVLLTSPEHYRHKVIDADEIDSIIEPSRVSTLVPV